MSGPVVGIDLVGKLFVDGEFGHSEGSIGLSMEGGGGSQHFSLDFVALDEEAFLQVFLGVLIDGVLADGAGDDVMGMSVKLLAEGSNPVSEVRVKEGCEVRKGGWGGIGASNDHGDSSNEEGALGSMPVIHLCVNILNGLIVKGVSQSMVIDGIREVECLQEFIVVRGNCTLRHFNATEAMEACDFMFIMIGNEEVVDP